MGRICFCRTVCCGKGQQRRELQASIPTVPKDPKNPTSVPHQPVSPAVWGSWARLIKKESPANPWLSSNCPSAPNGGHEGLQCGLAGLSWSLQLAEGAGRDTRSNFTTGPCPGRAASPRLGRGSQGSDSTCGLQGSPAALGKVVEGTRGQRGASGAWHGQRGFLWVLLVLSEQECESSGLFCLQVGNFVVLDSRVGAGTTTWC